MAHPAKDSLDRLYELCDSIDETPFGVKHEHSDLTLRNLLFVDTMSFILYLSAADGHVSWHEARYLSDLFECDMSTSAMEELIEKHNLYSVSFENKVPNTLPYFVKTDIGMIRAGKNLEKPTALLLIEFFESLGKHFLNCDSNVTTSERNDLDTYLTMMANYAQTEVKKAQSSISQKSTISQNSLKSRYGTIKKKL